jgi:hypothetical protein
MKMTNGWTIVATILLAAGCEVSAQETSPVGRTAEDQERNAALLNGYEYGKYTEALTGYTGQDRQRIAVMDRRHAIRTRVGPRGNYKAGMAALPDGTLVLATCRRERPDSPTLQIHIYRSTDLGLTWKEIGQTPLYGKEPSLTVLGNGSLILTAQKLGAKDIHLCRSSDGGRTWTTGTLPGADYPRNLIVESDGSVLMIRAPNSAWWGGNSPHLQLDRSKDGGRTWRSSEGIVDWSEKEIGEVASLRTKDGRLLAALRRQIPGTKGEGFEDTVITESTDNGRHWSKPRPLTRAAEVHVYMTELANGRILATYSNYHLPWGVYAMVSRDGGKTWDNEYPVELALSAGFSVGWAVSLQLPDRSLITCYAIEAYSQQQPDKFVTEVVRWELP